MFAHFRSGRHTCEVVYYIQVPVVCGHLDQYIIGVKATPVELVLTGFDWFWLHMYTSQGEAMEVALFCMCIYIVHAPRHVCVAPGHIVPPTSKTYTWTNRHFFINNSRPIASYTRITIIATPLSRPPVRVSCSTVRNDSNGDAPLDRCLEALCR